MFFYFWFTTVHIDSMMLAVDTYYSGAKAKTVGLAFWNWTDEEPCRIYMDVREGVAPYQPGLFYKRELPCILSLLKSVELGGLEAILVDGHVFLDDTGKPGLGAFLYEALEGRVPVIGVAKSNFATLQVLKREVRRGRSTRPLLITAIGMDPDRAAGFIKQMHGNDRLPTLLKQLDRFTRA